MRVDNDTAPLRCILLVSVRDNVHSPMDTSVGVWSMTGALWYYSHNGNA